MGVRNMMRVAAAGLAAIIPVSIAVALPAAAQAAAPHQVLVSELRFGGPAGVHDGYVELYDPTEDSGVTVTGWKLTYALADGSTSTVTLPTATIGPRGHFLVADSAYSLGSYAAPDTTTSLGAAPIGVRLTSPDGSVIVDAVGESTAPAGYREGIGLTPPLAASGQQLAWTRVRAGGTPSDSDNNAADFRLVDAAANPALAGTGAELGAPGPHRHTTVTQDNQFLQSALLDTSASATAPPNRVYDSASQTLIVRRIIHNTSQTQTYTSARIRLTGITTIGAPGSANPGQAILVAHSSPSETVATSHGNVQVKGTTLDSPPSAAALGGLDSSLTIPLGTGGLAPGASIPIEIRFAVQRTGSFSFTYDIEADPAPTIVATPASGHPPAPGAQPSTASLFTITGGGWPPGHAIDVKVGGKVVCSNVPVSADASGNLEPGDPSVPYLCNVPSGLPYGPQTLTAFDAQSASVAATGAPFTITPGARIDNQASAAASPGATVKVAVAGMTAGSPLTVRFDSTTVTTNPASPVTDAQGTASNIAFTVPAAATTGGHTVTVSDGPGHSAGVTLTIYRPTISISPTSGHPASGSVSATQITTTGHGWPPGDFIDVNMTDAITSSFICEIQADSSGSFTSPPDGGCVSDMPDLPAGSQQVLADDVFGPVTATGSDVTIVPVVSASASSVARGSSVDVSGAGFASGSTVHFTLDTTALAPTATAGTYGGEFGPTSLTIPSGTAPGTHTITATDAAGNHSSVTITVT